MNFRPLFVRISQMLIVLLVITGLNITYSNPNGYATIRQGDISVFLNDKEIALVSEPIISNGIVFVPLDEFSVALGMFYQRYGLENAILYKNNLFIKFVRDGDTAYLNGMPVTLKGLVFEDQNHLFVPLDFLATALDYDAVWDVSTGQYTLTAGSSDYKFAFFKDSFYKKIFVDQFGINFSVPIHWDRLATDRQSFGFMDNTELFSVRIEAVKLSQSVSLENYRDTVLKSITSNVAGLSAPPRIEELTSTRIDSQAMYYTVRQGPERISHVAYVFVQDHVGYKLDFVFNDYIDAKNASAIIRNVAESFQIDKLTIRESEEHYVEYRNFFSLGVKLDHELYSNQLVFNTQRLEGVLSDPDGVEQLLITVSKGTDKLEFIVPVRDGRFNARIYLPFGLGKHNILVERIDNGNFIFRARRDDNFEPRINYNHDNVLQFSLINASSDKIRYLVPTGRIPSGNEQILSVANLLTYKDITQYSKSRAVYLWMLTHVKHDAEEGEYSRDALKVFNDEIGTEEEISCLYVALLRSIGIPARLATGNTAGQAHIWVELLINGEWRIADIGHEYVEGSNNDGTLRYFWLDRTQFYQSYANIKILNE